MQNFGQNSRTSILQELSGGNVELGEAFAVILSDMVMQSGITNPKASTFDIVSNSWRTLADKPNKTAEEIAKLDTTLFDEIGTLAKSYLLYIAKETRNLTGKIDYAQFEAYMLKYRFGRYDVMNKPEYLTKVKGEIRNFFNKISSHGEASGDNLIDKTDMAAFIYAITIKSKRDDSNKFSGFSINGIIEPENYAVCDNQLRQPEDNLISLKLRLAYKILNNKI